MPPEKTRMSFRLLFVCMGLVMAASTSSLWAAKDLGIKSDSEFFSVLNLSYPGLEKVKEAVKKKDYQTAKKELIAHFKKRKTPVFFIDGRRNPIRKPNFDTSRADKSCAHTFTFYNKTGTLGKNIDWDANPTGDREWNCLLHRHSHIHRLAITWFHTRNKKYSREAVAQLLDWIKDKPVRSSNSIKKSSAGNAWRSLEAGIRMNYWLGIFYFLMESEEFDVEARIAMLKSFVEHGRYLIINHTNGNWLITESTGLAYLGIMFPEFREAAGWKKTALQRLDRELEKQVYPDGAQHELTPHYHICCLRNYWGFIWLAQLNDIKLPKSLMKRVEKMCEFSMYTSKPDGTIPMLNDSDALDVRKYLSEGLRVFDRADMKYVASAGKKGAVPRYTSCAFPYAGMFVMRSGWKPESRYLIVDAGPFGAGHQHVDKLSIDLYAYGKTLITDSGRYTYTWNKWRAYFKCTQGHNTIMVDGGDQWGRRIKVTSKPLDNKWLTSDGFDFFQGSFDGGYFHHKTKRHVKNVKHQRSVLFLKPDYWIVSDLITGRGKHRIESFFHFTPCDAVINPAGKTVRSNNDDANLIIIPTAPKPLSVKVVKGQENPVQGWVSVEFNKKEPAPCAIYSRKANLPIRMDMVLWPYPGKTPPRLSVKRLRVHIKEKTIPPSQALCTRINHDKGTDYFVLSGTKGKPLTCGDISFNAAAGCIRYNRNREITGVLLIEGTRITDTDGIIVSADKPLNKCVVQYRKDTIMVEMDKGAGITLRTLGRGKLILNKKEITIPADKKIIKITTPRSS